MKFISSVDMRKGLHCVLHKKLRAVNNASLYKLLKRFICLLNMAFNTSTRYLAGLNIRASNTYAYVRKAQPVLKLKN